MSRGPVLIAALTSGDVQVGNTGGTNVFFSSRRGHTILVSDWSSDVCSSDLPRARGGGASAGVRCDGANARFGRRRRDGASVGGYDGRVNAVAEGPSRAGRRRDVERRQIGRASCRERV